MNTKEAVAKRIIELCEVNDIAINNLAVEAGITPSTVYSLLNEHTKNPGIITIKKLCDALNLTLGEFFSTPVFDNLEQEIK